MILTMKKLPAENRVASFPSVVFYRDDIEDLIAMFGDSPGNVTLSDNELAFDSLDEMAKIRGLNLKCMTIRSATPFVSLTFSRLGSGEGPTILRSDPSERAAVIFLNVSEKMKSRRRLLAYVFTLWLWVPVTLVSLFFLNKPEGSPADPRSGVIFLAMFAATILSIPMQIGFFYRLSLSRPHEAKSWLKENAERMLLVFAGAVLGSLGTGFANWIANLFGDNFGK
jgi:hypothetical protein